MMIRMTRFQTSLLFLTLLASTMLACNLPLSQPEALPAPTLIPLSIDDYNDDEDASQDDQQQDDQQLQDDGDQDDGDDDDDEATPAPPTRTRRPTRTPVPTADPADDITETPLPTFTPIALPPTATLRGESGNDTNEESDESNEGDAGDENSETDPDEAESDQEAQDAVAEGEATPTLQPEFEPLELTFEQTWVFDSDDPNLTLATVILTATGGDGDYTYFRDDKQQPAAEFQYKWGKCQKNAGIFRVDSGDGQSVSLNFEDDTPC